MDHELSRAAKRAVEMIRWWPGAPTQLVPAWAVLSAALLEDGDLHGPARALAEAVSDRSTWPPDERRVMDDLADAVEAAETAREGQADHG
jgi:hypothetical protein